MTTTKTKNKTAPTAPATTEMTTPKKSSPLSTATNPYAMKAPWFAIISVSYRGTRPPAPAITSHPFPSLPFNCVS